MSESQAPEAAAPVSAEQSAETTPSRSRAEELASLQQQMNAVAEQPTADEEVAEPTNEAGEQESQPEEETTDTDDSGHDAETEVEGEETSSEKPVNKGAKNPRMKVDHLSDDERKVFFLVGKHGFTLEQAQRAVYGDQRSQQQQAQAEPDPVDTVDQQISASEARIADLEKQFDEAAFDPERQAQLRKEISTESRKLGRLETQKESAVAQKETSAKTAQQTESQKAFSRAYESFPDAFAPTEDGRYGFNVETKIGKAALAEYQFLEASGNTILNNPRALEIILNRAATQVGYERTAPSSSTVTKPVSKKTETTPNSPQKRSVRPVASGGTQPPAESAKTKVDAALKSRDPKVLLSAMAELGTRF